MSRSITTDILRALNNPVTIDSFTKELDEAIDLFLNTEVKTLEESKDLLERIDKAVFSGLYKGDKDLNNIWNSVVVFTEAEELVEDTTTSDEVIEVPVVEEERDYVILDITELDPVADGDVRSPEDITANLLAADAELNDSLGNTWGTINILSTRKPKDGITESALIEFRIGTKNYLASFIVNECEDGRKEFQVKDTLSKLIYSRKTNNVSRVMENYIRSLYDECKLSEKENN